MNRTCKWIRFGKAVCTGVLVRTLGVENISKITKGGEQIKWMK